MRNSLNTKNMSKITIHKLIPIYLNFMEKIKTCSTHTSEAYLRDLRQTFGPEKIQEAEDIEENTLLELARAAQTQWSQLSLASRNRKAATLKSFFQWLYAEGHTQKNWAHQVHAPKVPSSIPHFISVDEVISILNLRNQSPSQTQAHQNEEQHLQSELLFLLLYGGGLRVSEACHIRWKDFDWSARSLRVLGKGQKERIVVFPQRVMQTLSRYHTLQNQGAKSSVSEDFLFGDKPLHRRTAYEMIHKLGAAAGLQQGLHPHALRHSFATHLLTGGISLRILQELLGHESLTATQKYTHLSMDHLARTMSQSHPLGSKDK